jgi:hypothetical protein
MFHCVLHGRNITPEMPSPCKKCSLYLNTCMPLIQNGFIYGECDFDYCEWCSSDICEECYVNYCSN